MIIGHRDPHYLIDSADAIAHYNKDVQIVFAIDYNKNVYDKLISKYGSEFVFVSKERNGWGRGILRTIVHALEHFNKYFEFKNLITLDDDSLCVAPFVERLIGKIKPDSLFAGTIWNSPDYDHHFHHKLYNSGFLADREFHFKVELSAGPCMLWTEKCLNLLSEIGLYPAEAFEKVYPNIGFCHDQISTYLNSLDYGTIEDAGDMMTLRWREAVPTTHIHKWGEIPIINNGISVIHPVVSDCYDEMTCRTYFRRKRYSV